MQNSVYMWDKFSTGFSAIGRSTRDDLSRVIASLFSNNEPGFLTPISPSVCFTDTAGTTQAQVGQAVALALDSSRGLKLGPELVTNGTFDVDANWTKGAGWTIAGGAASCDGTNLATLSQPINFAVGKTFEVSFTIVSRTSGGVRLELQGGGVDTVSEKSVPGTYRELLRATADRTAVRLISVGGGFTGTIDNISVRELPGVHWTQPTLANRPILGRKPKGGRRNQFERTEEFDNAYWSKSNLSVVPNAGIAPNGAETADRLVPNGLVANHSVFKRVTLGSSGGRFTVQAKVKANSYAFFGFAVYNQPYNSEVRYSFNLNTLSRSWLTLSTPPTEIDATIEDIGNGWRLVTATAIFASGTAIDVSMGVNPLFENVWTVASAGDGVSGVLIAEAQLDFGLATPYQRVGSTFDVTEAGKADCHYLFCGGSADPRWMQTPTITPGTDKVQVFAGVRKLSDAASAALFEHSTISDTSDGSFAILAPAQNGSQSYFARSGGTTRQTLTPGAFAPAPDSAAITVLGDISSPLLNLRRSGASIAFSTSTQGTGNYLAYPAYIGARAGTSLYFNGEIYALGVRFGPPLPTATIEKVEQYVASLVAEDTI
jgi:hypothetical protein